MAPATPTPHGAPVPDPRALLTTLGERVLEREGIPMFLTLQTAPAPDRTPDHADPNPESPEPGQEGGQLADLLRHYRETLTPDAPDDSEPALIEVLQVMGAAHLFPQAANTPKENDQ
ncbi:hypothetical protein [Streptomyces sp. NPDC008150]|uniref:hypothetical protein n=1 Tax=Streptomyces sp. NPDC008150 TaxID=3364816 RepID=UPI0036E6D84D